MKSHFNEREEINDFVTLQELREEGNNSILSKYEHKVQRNMYLDETALNSYLHFTIKFKALLSRPS